MFGKRKEQPPETPGRYRVDNVPLVKLVANKSASVVMEEVLNAGDNKGWRLVSITHGGSSVLVTWDTQPDPQ
jgi:hypothetical protein